MKEKIKETTIFGFRAWGIEDYLGMALILFTCWHTISGQPVFYLGLNWFAVWFWYSSIYTVTKLSNSFLVGIGFTVPPYLMLYWLMK